MKFFKGGVEVVQVALGTVEDMCIAKVRCAEPSPLARIVRDRRFRNSLVRSIKNFSTPDVNSSDAYDIRKMCSFELEVALLLQSTPPGELPGSSVPATISVGQRESPSRTVSLRPISRTAAQLAA